MKCLSETIAVGALGNFRMYGGSWRHCLLVGTSALLSSFHERSPELRGVMGSDSPLHDGVAWCLTAVEAVSAAGLPPPGAPNL